MCTEVPEISLESHLAHSQEKRSEKSCCEENSLLWSALMFSNLTLESILGTKHLLISHKITYLPPVIFNLTLKPWLLYVNSF